MLRYSRCGVSLAKESSNVRGELTGRGYPYFAGTVSLESTFDWSFDTDGAVLSLEELDGCLVRVIVNGKDVGAICSMPYSLDISSALQRGENTLTLRLTNTLRNLIGPHHRPDGERGIVRGTYDDSDLGWMGARDNSDKEWYLDRAVDTPYWTDSYMLSRFEISGVKISAPVKK